MIIEGIKCWFERGADTPGSFSVHGIGLREPMSPGLINRPQGTGDILFMLFHHAVQARSETGMETCAPGSLIIWDVGMSHYYGKETDDWSHSWLHCGGGLAGQLIRESGLGTNRLIMGCVESFTASLERLHEERVRPDFDGVILRNHFENMLRSMKRAGGSSQTDPVPERLLRAKRRIETGHGSLSLAELAAEACLSPSHFSAEYRRYFGISPIKDATRRRMLEAEHLLRDINLSISEIATRVGYPDIFHFSKQFKRYYGESPSQRRRSKL